MFLAGGECWGAVSVFRRGDRPDFTPTPASDITEMLTLAHGLMAREREVLEQVIAGRSSTGIAAVLGVSPHTVQDHLTSVFGKFGVRSRGQLVARALGSDA